MSAYKEPPASDQSPPPPLPPIISSQQASTDDTPQTDHTFVQSSSALNNAQSLQPATSTSPLSPSEVVQEKTDSPNLPPHLRQTITQVPVTPDFGRDQDNPPPKRQKTSSFSAMGDFQESLATIRENNPDLALSGNIISATFNIPHSLEYRKGADWILKPRRGQSALFDSFSYLSSAQSQWNHTVVAWTGEIEQPLNVLSPPNTPPNAANVAAPLNALSAPISVDGFRPATLPPKHDSSDGILVSTEDMQRLENQLGHDPRVKMVPVWLADDTTDNAGDAPSAPAEDGIRLKDQGRWRRYAEHELYSLFHYKQHGPTDGRQERVQWADFYRMNQKFANKIAEVYKPGDIIIIHDYYLMLLPSMLRQRSPNMYISFFLHSPFPSSEFFRCLPRRREILEGVLGANMIGFQSYSYARHFASCCQRILQFSSSANGVDFFGSRVEFGVFPIGIDVPKVERYAWSDAVTKKYNDLRTMYAGKKIIVGRDRLDSIRGVDKKLQAFECFLARYPEWRDKVVLIQVTSPTSIEEEHDQEEAKIASRVNELVMSINGTYGSLGFSPVQHYPQYLTQDEYFALLRAGDIGLITSVRDGMNTTSLEYVVCQRDNHGPLIISEFSGTASSLREAIHINPWDYTVVADAIQGALSKSDAELATMQRHLYEHVKANGVEQWITKLTARLVSVLSARKNVAATPLLDRSNLLERYRHGSRRLFMFDYDGTLTPIVREPSAAVPSEEIIKALKVLAADHRNAVWIISGRDQEFLSEHLGHIKELGFSAEHGSFMRHPGEQEWENLAAQLDMGWQPEVLEVMQSYTDRVPGSFVERKRCALTWHYRLADPEQGLHMAQQCQRELESGVALKWDVEVMAGKANVEVRPTFINKGEIVKRLVGSYQSDVKRVEAVEVQAAAEAALEKDGALEFVLCMGDDATDEDMFRALNGLSTPHDDDRPADVKPEHLFTVTVGASTKVTLANWHLLEPEDVIDCVALLAGTAGPAETIGEVNLAAITSVEGKVPEEAEAVAAAAASESKC